MAEQQPQPEAGRIAGRVRQASVSFMNATPQLGMWQAAGTAIAQAPNISELRGTESGGDNIEFNAHGHSARTAVQESDGELVLAPAPLVRQETMKRKGSIYIGNIPVEMQRTVSIPQPGPPRRTLSERHAEEPKEGFMVTIKNGLKAFWKFFLTPVGFLITIYFLNIVAWGGMLFFMLLSAAPAMNYPTADDDNSPRKIWLEIDSQILNSLFCVTGFGLAPWRFRDFYYMIRVVFYKDKIAMAKLSAQNRSWFRPPAWATAKDGPTGNELPLTEPASGNETSDSTPQLKTATTFTGDTAPPTPMWKLAFCISMMALNTVLQAVLCYFMWGYNRFNRPSWATGLFIGLGCGVAMFAGLMSWWEGRKVKKIEGPEIQIIANV